MGTHVDSPLQRTCTSLLRRGNIRRIAATVFGASVSSQRALNVYGPAVMRSIFIAGVRYPPDGARDALHARARYDQRPARPPPRGRPLSRRYAGGERDTRDLRPP